MKEACENPGWGLKTNVVILLQDLQISDNSANSFDTGALGRVVPTNEWTGKEHAVNLQMQIRGERAKGKSFAAQYMSL